MRSTVAICLFLSISAVLNGQALTLSLSAPTTYPGATVTLNVSFADATPTAGASGFEWQLVPPAGLTPGVGTAGAAAITAAKALSCNNATFLCIETGINSNTFASGIVASYPLTVPATATPGTTFQFSLAGILGATLTGTAVANLPATAPAITLTVLNRFDLNGDGKVDILDLQLLIQYILTNPPLAFNPAFDFNSDTKINVLDVQLLDRAALGL
jgi:hypothetical protein